MTTEESKIESEVQGRKGSKKRNYEKLRQLNGVTLYLYDRGLKAPQDQHFIVKLYVIYMKWEDIPQEKHVMEACSRIQENFRAFAEWYKQNYLNIKTPNHDSDGI